MVLRSNTLESRLGALDRELAAVRPRVHAQVGRAVDRWRADAAAARFHLSHNSRHPVLLAVIGGTGTGKSTLVNRLLEADLSATSFRRTFTSGAVAIAQQASEVPEEWLGIAHRTVSADDLPARGQVDVLLIVPDRNTLTQKVTLVDTPDLDGDQPLHHAQADRAFRWAEAVLFLVSPEKYQMTELVPYYRLAERYGVPVLYVMNKCESAAMLEDYARQVGAPVGTAMGGLSGAIAGSGPSSAVFALPRDDAGYEPPAEANLLALREALLRLRPGSGPARDQGLVNRAGDLVGRLTDQVLGPLRGDRKQANGMIAAMRALETPLPGVDVNPITQQLQRRLQQRSVLYLMGPGRMLDRIRQVPGLLARLPRATWDVVIRGQPGKLLDPELVRPEDQAVPDFVAMLKEQFAVVQSRIEDALRADPAGERWIEQDQAEFAQVRIDPADAGRIAQEELAELKTWLEKRWNATPRDTAVLQRLLKHLPGGTQLAKWSEAAPYLLAVVVAAHHAVFGPIDLMVIGGFTLATWLSERLSNEVAARTRLTNRTISQRFEELAHRQINQMIAWLERQVPAHAQIDQLQRLTEELAESMTV
jgi:hypothetical protein